MDREREKYILNQLDRQGSVRVADLSEELGVSEVTIRGDIRDMEKRKLLKRTHGGAVRVREQLQLSMVPGNVFNKVEEKSRIAAKAYEYIEDEDTIILDDSSVAYYLAEEIRKGSKKNLVVITNSLAASVILSKVDHVIVFVVGGQLGGKLPATMGEVAVNTFRDFRADKAFISAHGLNFEVGITSIGTPQMQVKKAILDSADKIYVLIDSSKFSDGYILSVCPLSRITKIITDRGISPSYQNQATEKGIVLDIV